MNTKKETPNSKLQKSSVIFMQLGLILALLAVYFTLEHKSMVKYAVFETPDSSYIDKERSIDEIEIERPIIKPPKVDLPKVATPKIIIPKVIDKIKIIDNSVKEPETKVNSTEIEPNDVVKLTQPVVPVVIKKDEPIKTTSMKFVEIVPTFPGCTGTNEEKRICFNKKINKHVQKYFDIDLAQDLGLNEGKQRISIQFIIDQNGNVVEIKSRAPHKKLAKEAQRIMKKLPKMIPGQQNKKQVRVKFNLPINFTIVD